MTLISFLRHLVPVMILALLFPLSSCVTKAPITAPVPERAETPTEQLAIEAENKGEYLLASSRYQQLADTHTRPQRQHYQLKSIAALIKAGQYHGAKAMLRETNVKGLSRAIRARKLILLAQVSQFEGRHEKAIRLLSKAQVTPNLNPKLYSEIYHIKSVAELALENPIGAVGNLIQRQKYIADITLIDKNQVEIWEILNTLSIIELKQERNLTGHPELGGWLDLAIARASRPNQFNSVVGKWKQTHPYHQITESFLKTLTSQRPTFVGRVHQIALLLPLSSQFESAAKAVRDGFLYMNKRNPKNEKPRIKIYDTDLDNTEVTAVYNRAVTEGADFIVGPLGRESVQALFENTDLSTPTLVLSHAEEGTDVAGQAVFQFGLPPEQEAVQAAERAYLDGKRMIAILYLNNALGLRMKDAFQKHWQSLGGIVLDSQPFEPDQSDYSDVVKRLLNINDSEARHHALEKELRRKLKFAPRRRQDVEAIFLAANAAHGRLIKPQLNYHRASKVSVYSTSHIFTGKPDPIKDADLEGVIFGDMPWMLIQNGALNDLKKGRGAWRYAQTQLDRLFALGMDSYTIIPYLGRISSDNAMRFNGVTSGLSVDQDGQLHRHLLWARFKRGVPKLLDSYYNYTGQLKSRNDPSSAGAS